MAKPRSYLLAVTVAALIILRSWLSAPFHGTKALPTSLGNREFWEMVVNFSEPGGVFRANDNYRSDNLVSNERSLQQVIPIVEDTPRPAEFLSRLFARPRPTGLGSGSTARALFDAFETVHGSEAPAQTNVLAVFNRLERVHGFGLSRADENASGPSVRPSPSAGQTSAGIPKAARGFHRMAS